MSAFFDTNILIYSLEGDPNRSTTANRLIAESGFVSVQVLNETVNVLRGKLRLDWDKVDAVMASFRTALAVVPLTSATHDRGIALARRHRLSIYDAMIVAAALESGCDTLYSEDMHAGLVVGDRLTIVNPFA